VRNGATRQVFQPSCDVIPAGSEKEKPVFAMIVEMDKLQHGYHALAISKEEPLS
jgi:hypothetical protein